MNRRTLGLGIAAVGLMGLLSGGCASGPKNPLIAPQFVVAPYDSSRGEVLWAVAPLRNETGTTAADPLAITDALTAAAEEVRGVRTIPLNRTLQAMAALGMPAVRTPDEARMLASALGVDGVLVGSITSYDPYTPTLGLAVVLFARDGAMERGPSGVDVRELRRATTEPTNHPGSVFANAPIATYSDHLDAKNHQVLLDVQRFAEGRMDKASAIGWRRYTASMPLFTEFASFRVMEGLMQQEWIRLAGPGITGSGGTTGNAGAVSGSGATGAGDAADGGVGRGGG